MTRVSLVVLAVIVVVWVLVALALALWLWLLLLLLLRCEGVKDGASWLLSRVRSA
jgi:hypothetical protein